MLSRSIYAICGLFVGAVVDITISLLATGIQQRAFPQQFSNQALWRLARLAGRLFGDLFRHSTSILIVIRHAKEKNKFRKFGGKGRSTDREVISAWPLNMMLPSLTLEKIGNLRRLLVTVNSPFFMINTKNLFYGKRTYIRICPIFIKIKRTIAYCSSLNTMLPNNRPSMSLRQLKPVLFEKTRNIFFLYV